MATKPAKLPRWASTGGAALVEPTNTKKDVGWAPGEKPPAEYVNWLLNNLYLWAAWLDDFENNIHIWAELNSFNKGINVATTVVNGIAVNAGGNGSGEGVLGVGGPTGIGVRGMGKGASAAGVSGFGDTAGGSGGPGVKGTAGSGAAGVEGTGNSGGSGVDGTGGSTAGTGVNGTGGASSGIGVRGVGGLPNGAGVRGVGNGTGDGVQGVGGGSDGVGVHGTGGSTNGIGVLAEGTGTGTALRAVGGNNGAAIVAKTSSNNDTATAPAMVLDALDAGNRHRFHVDQLGLPGGRISHVHESWQYEDVFQGNAGGERIPDTLMWYHDTTGGNKGSVIIGTANILLTDATNDQGVRGAKLSFTGDTGEYSQLYSSQQCAAKANCLFAWEWEAFFLDYVASDNEFRMGLLDVGSQYVTGRSEHDPTANDRVMLVARNSVNGAKFQVEWEKGGTPDAAVDAGVVPSGYVRVRVEVLTSGVGGARTTVYLNGAKVYSKADVITVPLGFSASLEGKVMAGGGEIHLSPLDLYAARYAVGATAL